MLCRYILRRVSVGECQLLPAPGGHRHQLHEHRTLPVARGTSGNMHHQSDIPLTKLLLSLYRVIHTYSQFTKSRHIQSF